MKIVVIGGTGLIGSKLIELLRGRGHEPLAASPDTGVDTLTGEGLAEALRDADVVVDVSNSPSFADADVLAFFQTSTTNLLAAELDAGVKHHVAVSIVGTDRLPDSGYLRAKVAQEALVKQGAVPYTILRSTQFFEFLGAITAATAEDGAVHLSGALMQPVAANDVAETLADIAVSKPLSGTVELGGPEAFPLAELARQYLANRGDRRPVITDAAAPYFGTRLDHSSLVPGHEARRGRVPLADWLTSAAAQR